MSSRMQVNADRFVGFADIYDKARPKSPDKVKELLLNYLGKKPSCIVDLGCGTGLSTLLWCEFCDSVIGIEPSVDMLEMASLHLSKFQNLQFIKAFSDSTGLPDNSVDIITCSQSFHWMNPETTLDEADRLLKPGGIFAAYDCDWPPVCHWEAENEYNRLFAKVNEIEASNKSIKDRFIRWDKDKHLLNIRNSGKFRYVREIVFSNTEDCNAERFIAIALSQGGLQAIMKSGIEDADFYLDVFRKRIIDIFGDKIFHIDFCYRMRIGVK